MSIWTLDKLRTPPAVFIDHESLVSKDVHEFGQRCYVTILPYRGKTDQRRSLGIYLGRFSAVFGHIILVPTQNGSVDAGYFI